MTECIKGKLAMVSSKPAVSTPAEGQVIIGQVKTYVVDATATKRNGPGPLISAGTAFCEHV